METGIFNDLENSVQFQQLADDVRKGKRLLRFAGLSGSSKALVVAALQKATGRRFALVSMRGRDLEALENDLRFFYCSLNGKSDCEAEVFTVPASEADPYSGTSPHAEILERQALALWQLATSDKSAGQIVMLTARSLIQRFIAPNEIKQAEVRLRVGDELPLGDLLSHLQAVGYVRADPVSNIGEYSSRGGILDFYAPVSKSETGVSEDAQNETWPIRVEFFGDEIDSIREFDPETQRSLRQVNEAVIVPMRDERASAEDFKAWAKAAREHWRDERYERALRDRTVFADEGESFQGWEYLLPLTRPLEASIFDYLRDAVLIV
ncbi:MAG TPA: hypothetical protein VEF04_22410, partial [Blastocatellia bacterium]|nr:hypothetical protein [Blastocatellia bacterium]